MGNSSGSERRVKFRVGTRRGWVQDATFYIAPTSAVRDVYLDQAWTELDSGKLAAKLGV